MGKDGDFSKTKDFKKESVEIEMDWAGIVKKINVGFLSVKYPPAGVQESSHIHKIETTEGIVMEEISVPYKDADKK